MEEKERLLAVDKDIADEEDEEIAKATDLRDPEREATILWRWERKLVCVDETSKCLLSLLRKITLYK